MAQRPGVDFPYRGGVLENLGDGSDSIVIGTDLIENFDSSDDFQGWFPFLDSYGLSAALISSGVKFWAS